jgi:catechol 2,3-dioxygenase-like lactoylglutathione lyase family enzyme
MTYPRTFSHIGLSVTNLQQTVDFYTKVLGWFVIMPPTEIVADDSAISGIAWSHIDTKAN